MRNTKAILIKTFIIFYLVCIYNICYICTQIIIKTNIMTNTMELAIKTYASLTNQTFKKIVELSLSGDEVVNNNIMKLMFSLA